MKYKLQRKSLKGFIKSIMKENNIKKEDIIIPIAGLGVVTVLWTSSLILINHRASNSFYSDSKHIFNKQKIAYEQEIDNYEELVNYDNYDIKTIAKLDDNYGSLYNENDVLSYRNKYGDIVHDKAVKWGIDENLLLAILTEESRQGTVLNLMQIEFDSWKDVPFRVYDFEKEQYVDILLTDDVEKYNSPNYITINRDDLNNPETNISIGAAIMQDSLSNMNYHVPAAIQCYNYGVTKMNNTVFVNMEQESSKTKNVVLNDQYDLEFMNNTILGYGDPNYLYDVARFINPNLAIITILKHTENGNEEIRFDIKKLLDGYHKYQENDLGHKL